MKDYRIVNDEVIQLVEGPYSGITYKYGGVKLTPDYEADTLKLKFDYEMVHGSPPEDVVEFHNYIGDILQELIIEQLGAHQIVYAGGKGDIDED